MDAFSHRLCFASAKVLAWRLPWYLISLISLFLSSRWAHSFDVILFLLYTDRYHCYHFLPLSSIIAIHIERASRPCPSFLAFAITLNSLAPMLYVTLSNTGASKVYYTFRGILQHIAEWLAADVFSKISLPRALKMPTLGFTASPPKIKYALRMMAYWYTSTYFHVYASLYISRFHRAISSLPSSFLYSFRYFVVEVEFTVISTTLYTCRFI